MGWIILIAIISYIIFYISKQAAIKEAEEKYEAKVKSDLLRRQRLAEEKELQEFRDKKQVYMSSTKWYTKRQERLEIDNFECKLCNSIIDLKVHHKTYKRIFNEDINDLVTLCSDCHTAIHDKYGYPQTMDDYRLGWFWKND